MKEELRGLWDRGVRVLDIYWLQGNRLGDERWWCDVINDEICAATGEPWTWTVTSSASCLDADGDDSFGIAFDDVMVEGIPYSEEAVSNAIVQWLHDKALMFDVRVVDPSGTIGERRMLELLNED